MSSNHPFVEAICNQPSSCSWDTPATVEHQSEHFLASAEIAQVGPLAAELLTLRFAIPGTTSWPVEKLRDQAKALAERVQYLLEPLAVIETDADSATVQIRSTQPAKLDDGRAYYEVLARPGTLHLCRYATQPGATRQQTPMQLTYEQLNRLMCDVASVVD